MNRRLWIAVLVGLLVAGGLAPAAGATAADGGPATTAANVTVDDALADAGGTQTVIVQLTDPAAATVRGTTGKDRASALQAHAAASRVSFERFADGNPHITIERKFWLTNALVVTVDTDRVPLARLGTVGNVERVHENHKVQVDTTTGVGGSDTGSSGAGGTVATPNETTTVQSPPTPDTGTTATSGIDYTRALEEINVPSVIDQGYSGEGVRVAVIDTGVNPDHPDIDIADENWACFEDCEFNPDGPHDVDGHGTHVSGTIVGGNANDAQLQIGVAPDATLMHAKGLGDDGNGSYSSIVGSMEWAVENNADVLSMSLGSDGYDRGYVDPVRNAEASGTIVVAAVGNAGPKTSGSPGNVYDAVSVGSVDVEPGFPRDWSWYGVTDGAVTTFSGGEMIERSDWFYPPQDWPILYTVPDVTAPGNIIWSADTDTSQVTACGDRPPTADLACMSGTSMAAPHVSGVIALMHASTDRDLSPAEVKAALDETAVDIGDTPTRQGAGRVDAAAAVTAVKPQSNLTVTDVSTPKVVTAGRSLTAKYTVENVGDKIGNGQVQFVINGTVVRTNTTGSLAPGNEQLGTFDYRTTSADTTPLNVSIATETTTRNRVVDVVPPEVQLTDVSLTPETVSKTEMTTHTLDFTVLNVSDDGRSDTLTLTLPDSVSLQGVETVTATDAEGRSVLVDAETVSSTDLAYTMSPNSSAELRDVNLTIEFTTQAN